MAYSDEIKLKKVKGYIIKRLKNINSLPVLITFLRNLNWTKIKTFLGRDLQEYADNCDVEVTEKGDDKTNALALKDEIDQL